MVGTGPGSFTSTRIGLAVARGLALALEIDGAGVSTLDALAAAGGARVCPVIDARRGEVFVPGPAGAASRRTSLADGRLCVGNGAVRYRDVLEANGARRAAGRRPRHLPRARLHASLATAFGPVDAIEPIYVRAPDAERWHRDAATSGASSSPTSTRSS